MSTSEIDTMDLNDWVVVMPSIRQIDLNHLAAIPRQVPVIVVDDSNGGIEPTRPNMEVYRYDDYRRHLGIDEELIPRKTDTCRSFGFWLAWKRGYRYIVTLDDDCVTQNGFLAQHAIIGQTKKIRSVTCEPWYNTLDNLELETNNGDGANEHGANGNGHNGNGNHQNGKNGNGVRYFARGVPYCYRKEMYPQPQYDWRAGRVVCNMGMWLNTPDINGLDRVGNGVPKAVTSLHDTLAVASGTNFSLCIMNVGFLAEIVPCFYQLPMNIQVCGARLDRFGDIWSGYILKRLVDRRGDVITLGNPLVTHIKAGNAVREAHAEHFGHLLENYFYPIVDAAADAVEPAEYHTMYHQFAENFLSEVSRARLVREYDRLFVDMGGKMLRWANLFCRNGNSP